MSELAELMQRKGITNPSWGLEGTDMSKGGGGGAEIF